MKPIKKRIKQYIQDDCIIVAYRGPSAINLYIVNKEEFEKSSDDDQVTISLISPIVDLLDRWEWVDLFSYTPLKKQVKVIDTGVNWCNLAEKYKKIDNEILWKIERYNANISSIDDNYQFLLVKQI